MLSSVDVSAPVLVGSDGALLPVGNGEDKEPDGPELLLGGGIRGPVGNEGMEGIVKLGKVGKVGSRSVIVGIGKTIPSVSVVVLSDGLSVPGLPGPELPVPFTLVGTETGCVVALPTGGSISVISQPSEVVALSDVPDSLVVSDVSPGGSGRISVIPQPSEVVGVGADPDSLVVSVVSPGGRISVISQPSEVVVIDGEAPVPW